MNSCGTATDNNVDLLPNYSLITSVYVLDCPPMLLPKVIVCDVCTSFLTFVCFFKVSPVLPISFSRNEIPGKYKYSNI